MNATVPTDDFAVRTQGLSKKYGDRAVVDDLDLSVRKGELFALLGPNGAGKTTTLRMLCGLLRPSEGTVMVQGRDVAAEPLAVKRITGVSPQETAVAERLNARENLRLMGMVHDGRRDEVERRARRLLEVTGLADRAAEQVRRFSGGMKRRLSIAMALVSDPEVLFLDEPTLGLDPQARARVWEYIAELKEAKTVVLTTHYLEEADALADRIAIMDEGRIVALGTSEELKAALAGPRVMKVKAKGLDDRVVEGLRERYGEVVEVAGGVEIRSGEIDVYSLHAYLRGVGAVVESLELQEATLDEVFLQLTGRGYRQ